MIRVKPWSDILVPYPQIYEAYRFERRWGWQYYAANWFPFPDRIRPAHVTDSLLRWHGVEPPNKRPRSL
jgi:hypothetical protein